MCDCRGRELLNQTVNLPWINTGAKQLINCATWLLKVYSKKWKLKNKKEEITGVTSALGETDLVIRPAHSRPNTFGEGEGGRSQQLLRLPLPPAEVSAVERGTRPTQLPLRHSYTPTHHRRTEGGQRSSRTSGAETLQPSCYFKIKYQTYFSSFSDLSWRFWKKSHISFYVEK